VISLEHEIRRLIQTNIVIKLSELASKFGLSEAEIREKIKDTLENTSNHSFVFIPKSNAFLELSKFKSLISQRGVVNLSELAKELNTNLMDVRTFINSLVVVGYPGIYIGINKFVTMQFLIKKVREIVQKHGKLTINEVARMFNIDEKVAYNLYEELKREGILK